MYIHKDSATVETAGGEPVSSAAERDLQDLVDRAKRDPAAFGVLYDLHYSRIFNYALHRTASLQAAQDITSEVFFKALNNISRFRWQGIPFSAWLYRIANNETATYMRHRADQQVRWEPASEFDTRTSPAADDEIIQAEAELERHGQYLALHDHIRRLDIKYQEVIALRFFENKQINEISAVLGKSDGTVKSLLHRGLQKLRTSMEECNLFRDGELSQ